MTAWVKRFRLVAPLQSEHDLQIDCTKMMWPILQADVCWTAIDLAMSLNTKRGRNGIPIGLLEAAKRKKRGCMPGVPDYLFWHRARSFAIEMKKSCDDVLSEDQVKFLTRLIGAGCSVSVCWTIDQVFRKTCNWGLVRPGAMLI